MIGIKPYIVVSGSMEPVIPTGSLIYSAQKNTYDSGDIVAFMQGGSVISHRIEEKVMVGSEPYYSTKGDANSITDEELVSQTRIIGAVVNVLPSVGSIIMLLRNPYSIMVGLCLPLGLLLYLYILNQNRQISLQKA